MHDLQFNLLSDIGSMGFIVSNLGVTLVVIDFSFDKE